MLNDASIEMLQALFDLLLIDMNAVIDGNNIRIPGNSLSKHKGEVAKIQLTPSRHPGENSFFAFNLDDMLSKVNYLHSPPLHFYIADRNYYSDECTNDPIINNYFETIRFVAALNNASDLVDKNNSRFLTLYYLQGSKLDIQIQYSAADISPLNDLEQFLETLESKEHKEQKRCILKTTLVEILGKKEPSERFVYLLRHFSIFKSRFIDSLNLYLSEFSMDKVREAIVEKKLEYTKKINDVFSEIQGKLLAIPVALILIGGQMKSAESISLNNTLVLVGAVVFSIFMFFLLGNQRSTLDAIKEDLESQRKKLETDHAAIKCELEKTFTMLDYRYNKQMMTIKIIDRIVWLGLALAIILFIYNTPPLWDWFASLPAKLSAAKNSKLSVEY